MVRDPGYTAVTDGYFTVRVFHRFAELWWNDEARPCSVCKGPTHWQRPTGVRGAATHPWCEPGNIRATGEVFAQALAAVFEALPVVEVQVPVSESNDEREPRKHLGNPRAGCSRCGRPYAALWVAARTWRCAEHPPADEEYRRGW